MLAPIVAVTLALLPVSQGTPPAPAPGRAGTPAPMRGALLPAPALSHLFAVAELPQLDGKTTVVSEVPAGSARRKVVCGMTLIIVDSAIDPRFVVAPTPGAGEPSIRRSPKPMCGDAKR
jgi:hypothetical protein